MRHVCTGVLCKLHNSAHVSCDILALCACHTFQTHFRLRLPLTPVLTQQFCSVVLPRPEDIPLIFRSLGIYWLARGQTQPCLRNSLQLRANLPR